MASSWIFLGRAEKDAVAAEAAEAANAGIILLLRNPPPPHWWKVRLASSWIFLWRAEKDLVFWWRASPRGVFFYIGGKWRLGGYSLLSLGFPLPPCLFPLTPGLPLLWMSLTTQFEGHW